MKKKFVLFLAVIGFLAVVSQAWAFIPVTPHLLHLVVQKIKQPEGLGVSQSRTILGEEGESAHVVTLEEELLHAFPGKLRSEIVTDSGTQFYVVSDSRFVRVVDGVVTAVEKTPVDYYADLLLYRDHESLLKLLVDSGVDTQTVSLQRLDKRICYFIGSLDPPGEDAVGLWIEKDSFFPVQYVIRKNGWRLTFVYDNWQRVSRSWYPGKINVLVDGHAFADIRVNRIELKSGLPLTLFDVDEILGQYPIKNKMEEYPEKTRGQVDELDRQIEDFKKIYE